jgi:hypothetical protein
LKLLKKHFLSEEEKLYQKPTLLAEILTILVQNLASGAISYPKRKLLEPYYGPRKNFLQNCVSAAQSERGL